MLSHPTQASQTALARRILRGLHALTTRGGEPSLVTLLALVPASRTSVCAMLLSLDREGYIDGENLRLTMRGFAAMQLPRVLQQGLTVPTAPPGPNAPHAPMTDRRGVETSTLFGEERRRRAVRKAVRVA